MKSKFGSQQILTRLFLVLLFAICSSPAWATNATWNDGSGDWFVCMNWNPTCPDSNTDAYINNSGKAHINSGGAAASSLTLGSNSTDSGGVFVDGTSGGGLEVSTNLYVGVLGTGSLSITNGGTVQNLTNAYIAASTSVSGPSNGSATVTGSGSTWYVGDIFKTSGRLFVGGNENEDGGTALLSITNGGTVFVTNSASGYSVKVGPSGTLSGNGTLYTASSTVPLTEVAGTLKPSGGQLTITGDVTFLTTAAAMQCNVVPAGADNVSVSGTATLNGRLSVTMTGTFTPGTQFTLLHAATGRNNTFSSVSITYPPVPTYTPVITYDANNVYLYLCPN